MWLVFLLALGAATAQSNYACSSCQHQHGCLDQSGSCWPPAMSTPPCSSSMIECPPDCRLCEGRAGCLVGGQCLTGTVGGATFWTPELCADKGGFFCGDCKEICPNGGCMNPLDGTCDTTITAAQCQARAHTYCFPRSEECTVDRVHNRCINHCPTDDTECKPSAYFWPTPIDEVPNLEHICVIYDKGTHIWPPPPCPFRSSADIRVPFGAEWMRCNFVVDSFFDIAYDAASGASQFGINAHLVCTRASAIPGGGSSIPDTMSIPLGGMMTMDMAISGSVSGIVEQRALGFNSGSASGPAATIWLPGGTSMTVPMPTTIGMSGVVGGSPKATFTDLGGGAYSVDSFFDVFYQISIDTSGAGIQAASTTSSGRMGLSLSATQGPLILDCACQNDDQEVCRRHPDADINRCTKCPEEQTGLDQYKCKPKDIDSATGNIASCECIEDPPTPPCQKIDYNTNRCINDCPIATQSCQPIDWSPDGRVKECSCRGMTDPPCSQSQPYYNQNTRKWECKQNLCTASDMECVPVDFDDFGNARRCDCKQITIPEPCELDRDLNRCVNNNCPLDCRPVEYFPGTTTIRKCDCVPQEEPECEVITDASGHKRCNDVTCPIFDPTQTSQLRSCQPVAWTQDPLTGMQEVSECRCIPNDHKACSTVDVTNNMCHEDLCEKPDERCLPQQMDGDIVVSCSCQTPSQRKPCPDPNCNLGFSGECTGFPYPAGSNPWCDPTGPDCNGVNAIIADIDCDGQMDSCMLCPSGTIATDTTNDGCEDACCCEDCHTEPHAGCPNGAFSMYDICPAMHPAAGGPGYGGSNHCDPFGLDCGAGNAILIDTAPCDGKLDKCFPCPQGTHPIDTTGDGCEDTCCCDEEPPPPTVMWTEPETKMETDEPPPMHCRLDMRINRCVDPCPNPLDTCIVAGYLTKSDPSQCISYTDQFPPANCPISTSATHPSLASTFTGLPDVPIEVSLQGFHNVVDGMDQNGNPDASCIMFDADLQMNIMVPGGIGYPALFQNGHFDVTMAVCTAGAVLNLYLGSAVANFPGVPFPAPVLTSFTGSGSWNAVPIGGGLFAVDSFFDIVYSISFPGPPPAYPNNPNFAILSWRGRGQISTRNDDKHDQRLIESCRCEPITNGCTVDQASNTCTKCPDPAMQCVPNAYVPGTNQIADCTCEDVQQHPCQQIDFVNNQCVNDCPIATQQCQAVEFDAAGRIRKCDCKDITPPPCRAINGQCIQDCPDPNTRCEPVAWDSTGMTIRCDCRDIVVDHCVVDMATNTCINDCPYADTTCKPVDYFPGTNRIRKCDCVPVQEECRPAPVGHPNHPYGCEEDICPTDPNAKCEPTKWNSDQTVLECDCKHPYDPPSCSKPEMVQGVLKCVNKCPVDGFECRPTAWEGDNEVRCDCFEIVTEQPGCPNVGYQGDIKGPCPNSISGQCPGFSYTSSNYCIVNGLDCGPNAILGDSDCDGQYDVCQLCPPGTHPEDTNGDECEDSCCCNECDRNCAALSGFNPPTCVPALDYSSTGMCDPWGFECGGIGYLADLDCDGQFEVCVACPQGSYPVDTNGDGCEDSCCCEEQQCCEWYGAVIMDRLADTEAEAERLSSLIAALP